MYLFVYLSIYVVTLKSRTVNSSRIKWDLHVCPSCFLDHNTVDMCSIWLILGFPSLGWSKTNIYLSIYLSIHLSICNLYIINAAASAAWTRESSATCSSEALSVVASEDFSVLSFLFLWGWGTVGYSCWFFRDPWRIHPYVCHILVDPHLPSTKSPVLWAFGYHTTGSVMG